MKFHAFVWSGVSPCAPTIDPPREQSSHPAGTQRPQRGGDQRGRTDMKELRDGLQMGCWPAQPRAAPAREWVGGWGEGRLAGVQ